MRKINFIISLIFLISITFTKVNSDEKFSSWIIEFKKKAINDGISEKTVDAVMNNAIFLPKVITPFLSKLTFGSVICSQRGDP